MKDIKNIKLEIPTKITVVGIVFIIIIFAYGILGSIYIMHLNIENALYFTMITIATVGYGDITPTNSVQKLFVIFLAFAGIGIIAYIFSAIIDNFSIKLEKTRSGSKMKKKLENMENHYIVCGYGRVGRVVINELLKRNQKIIIIDNDKEVIENIKENEKFENNGDIVILYGDATDQDIMDKFNIEKSNGLILTTGSDVNNVFIVLSLRDKAPNSWIVSRASKEENIERLYNAGADKVISPETSGGIELFLAALKPYLVKITDMNHNELLEKEIEILLKYNCNIENIEYHLPGIEKPFKREISIRSKDDLNKHIHEINQNQKVIEVIEEISNGIHSQLISGSKESIDKAIEELKRENLLIGVNMTNQEILRLNQKNIDEILNKN